MENQNAVASTKHLKLEGMQRMLALASIKRLEAEQAGLDSMIAATPTGPIREELTNANITLYGAITYLKDLL